MRHLIYALGILTCVSCTSDHTNSAQIDSEDSDIKIGQEAKSTLAKHGADTFRVNLKENTFITGVANQFTVDVIVTLLGPDRKELGRIDVSGRGPESFFFSTKQSGIHRFVVTPYEENAGDYSLKINTVEAVATDPEKRIDQLVLAMIPGDGPGVSIAVAREGKLIYSKGFGHANLEYDIHNTPTTVFHIASVSKQFTAFAIAMLVDQGKLSLDDDIRKHLPELHDFGVPVTVRQLIHHTSGLRDQWNLLAMAGWRLDDVITRQQILRVISRQRELNFKPGDQHNYCNTGYTLMAEIVSRVTGTPFPQWTKENIFDPLEMKNTLFYDDHEKIVYNRAYSYYLADTIAKKSVLNYANTGATSLFTTVEDLSKWADNFLKIKVGNPGVMAMMEQRFVLNNGDTIDYAFGQVIGKYKGLKTFSHGGADAGYRSFLLRIPEHNFSVVVFSNLASFNTGSIAYSTVEAYLTDVLKEEPKKEETPPQPAPKPEPFDASKVKLSDYTGRYYSEELETYYDLEVKNDTLIAHHQRHDDFKLIPTKQDGFQTTVWWMGNLEFTRDGGRKVNGMKANSGRVMNLGFVRR